MEDLNVLNDLRQLSHGHYDINGYLFWMAKLEAIRPLAATTNNGVVTSGEVTIGHVTDYYDILQNTVEYTFGSVEELKIVFLHCDWFDPISGTRMDDFGMVEIKHE
jgi:hypothetical protein